MPIETKPYAVFLSHSHADADFVKQLAEKLQDDYDLEPWLDQWDLVPGQPWLQGMAKGMDEAASCAVCFGSKTPAGWFQREYSRAINRQTQESAFGVIPVLLPGSDPALVGDFLELNTWVDLRKGLADEEAMYKLACGIEGKSPRRRVKKNDEASLFTVPFPDNPFFTERGTELRDLEELLNQRGIAALTGMGGMGKTQTAAKFAYLHRDDYPAVLWARAESVETLYADFTRFAALLKLPESTAQDQQVVVAAVKSWLAAQPRWLLVLDNVVDLRIVSQVKSDARGHHIIVTTQAQATGAIGAKDLPVMGDKIGALLLLRRAGLIGPEAALTEAQPQGVETARSISHKLGGLPLALDQAGAYVSETGCGLHDYRDLLDDNLPELLARRGELDNEHESVARTFVKSMEELAKRNPAAADLVKACAFLAPDAIPEEIFGEGASEFTGPLEATLANKLAWNEAIAATLKFSLLDRDAERKTLSVHRGVQAVVRWNMGEEERRGWAQQMVRAVNSIYPNGTFDVREWPRCERLLPHAEACAGWIKELDISSAEAGRLLNQAAAYLLGRARFNEAEPLMRRALAIDEKSYGPNHPKVATRLNNLAALLKHTNQLAEAEPLMRRALAIDEKSVGPDHPKVAIRLNNIAALLQDTNRLAEAEPLMRRALEIDEKSYGPDHPNVAIRLNNLARLLHDTNRLAEAEPLMCRVIETFETSYGPEHPDVATSLNNLAQLLQDTNRLAEAEPLMRRALAIDEKSYGPDHPDVAIDFSNLAGLLQATNRLADAEPLMRRALSIFEASLGSDHPYTITVRENLEALLRARSQHA